MHLNNSIWSVIFLLIFLAISCKTVKQNPDFLLDIQDYRDQQRTNLSANESTPLSKESVKQLDFFKPDQDYLVIADVVRLMSKESINISTYSGIEKEFIEYATLSFELFDESYTLTTHKNLETMRMPQYRNKMFLMFTDLTTGKQTYGGGRYIYIDEAELMDGKIPLDFNKAFNPYCAYADGYNCPIPPPQNDMAIAIKAGEKDFVK